MRDLSWSLRADHVFLTHIHFDRAGSIGRTQRDFPNAKLLVEITGTTI